MELKVRGESVRATTGGRPLDTTKPLVVFVHGASQDRTVWAMQMRYFSHHGWSVLSPDLPGHGLSTGDLLESVEDMARWLGEVIEEAGFDGAALVGHSMGSLIALELASARPEMATKLVLTGSTSVMSVHESLQSSADANERRAHEMIMGWSLASQSGKGGHPTPGLWMHGNLLQTSLNAGDDVLANDLRASHHYGAALERAATVACPTLVVMGDEDRMVNAQGAEELISVLGAEVAVISKAGHSMMVEQPDAVLDALIGFLAD